MKIHRSAIVLGLIAVAAASTITVGAPAAHATTLSTGCATMASGALDGQYNAISPSDYFFAGERIVFSAGDPRAGFSPATTFSLSIDGAVTDLTTFPGILEHTFLADTNQVTWAADFFDNVTWVMNCSYVGLPVPTPLWHQAVGRASKDAGCSDGWNPSWQEWAIASTGGWVCARAIPMYGQ
jgi:hypothetical protein